MELQINKVKGKQVNRTVDNVVISEGSLTYCVKNNEYGVDLDNIDFAAITDSPNAAPDLLAALKDIVATCNVRIDDPRCKYFDAARAAIAKAEGGE